MELDERGHRVEGILDSGPSCPVLQELFTHVDEKVGEQRFLTSEMTVDGGTTHAGFGGEVLHRHGAKTPFREQSRGGANQSLSPFGLHSTSLGHLIHRTIPLWTQQRFVGTLFQLIITNSVWGLTWSDFPARPTVTLSPSRAIVQRNSPSWKN